MCGILAHFNSNFNSFNVKEFIEEMCYMRRRGDRGVGLGIIYKNGDFEVVKNMESVLNMGQFIRDYYDKMEKVFSNPNTWAVLMHGRKPAFAHSKNGTQPFYSKRFFLMHQGAVFSIFDYLPLNPNYRYSCDTDSERMLSYFMKYDNDVDFSPVNVMEELYYQIGEIGIIAIYDRFTKSLYFYRDDVRWLYYEESDNGNLKKVWNLKSCSIIFANDWLKECVTGIYRIKVGKSKLELIKRLSGTKKTFLKNWRKRR